MLKIQKGREKKKRETGFFCCKREKDKVFLSLHFSAEILKELINAVSRNECFNM